MKNKSLDLKALLVYIAMLFLILIIISPPLLRAFVREGEPVEVDNVPKITALLCRKQLVYQNIQYDITTNSTYQNKALQKVTFTYRSSDLFEEQTEEENSIESSQDENTNVSPETQEPSTNTNTVEEELAALQSIPGMEMETDEDTTKLTLTKDIVSTFEENSPYLSYFQEQEKQKEFFQNQGYSCQIMKT